MIDARIRHFREGRDWMRPLRLASAAALAFAGAALLVEVLLVSVGARAEEATVRNALVAASIFAAALATLLRAAIRPAGRAAWAALGLAIVSYGCAFLVFFFLQKTLSSFPSPADFFWLAFYPLVVVAIAQLVREQRRSDRFGVSLDAVIVTLAFAAVGYDLLFDGLVKAGLATDLVGGQLSYSVLDLAVLVMLAFVCLPSRAKLGRAYFVIGAGMLVVLLGDILVVEQIADGTYVPGTLLDATWPAGMILLAAASWCGTSLERVSGMRGSVLYGSLVVSFALALGLLVEEALNERNPTVIVIAGLVLLLVLLRLVLSVRENDRLARDNDGIIRAAGEGIFRTDAKGHITSANPAAREMLGYRLEEMLGRRSHELIHHTRPNGMPYAARDCPAGQAISEGVSARITDELFWRKDGSSFPVEYTSAPIRENGRIVGAVTVFNDVTRERHLREQLSHQAAHDSLTGLLNRARFSAEVSEQLAYAERYAHPGVLLLLDLDAFKFVNDSYGHPAGDRLLCEVSGVLNAMVRETDVVARLGADEFAVLLREANTEEGVEIAQGLIAAVRGKSAPNVSASVGVAPFDGVAQLTPDELLICADVALYEAKEAGGAAAVVYSGQRGQALTWVERIRSALAEDRLTIHSQPIVDLATGVVASEELLVRMLDPHGDRIPPGSFLPAAERFGLINEIDLWVLEKACELVERGAAVAVNVSARTLNDSRYLVALERRLVTGVDPGRMTFEITETAAVGNMAEAQDFASRIRELGCSLALDDFGTGFGSFTYLKHIPAQYLKIDAEFVRELERSPADQQLIRAMVEIARGFGQRTVAEGVEDERTMALVRKLGVDYAQGFHVGRPKATEQVVAERAPGGEMLGET